MDSRVPISVANVVQSDSVGPREAGSGYNQDAPPGILSSLIAQLLRTAQEDSLTEEKVPPDAGARRPSVAPGCGNAGTEPVIRGRIGNGVFLVWPSGTWGEQMLPDGHFLSISTAGLVG